jgi:hypothetical protein
LTHSPLFASQMGWSVEHCALEEHANWHRRSPPHWGCAGGQSALDRQPTHRPSATKQNGAAVPQSVLVRHATHDPVAALQNGLGVPVQSMSAEQPAQTPVWVLHVAFFPQLPAVHAAWHAWSPGKHAGAAAGQSALVAHTSH